MASKLKENVFLFYRKFLISSYGRVFRYRIKSSYLFGLLYPYENTIKIQDSKMYVNIFEKDPSLRNTFRAYALNLIHEKETTELFKNEVKEGNIVIDMGANIGYFSLLAAKLVGKKGKVYSFEPEPRNFSYLNKNIELNKYTNVSAFQKAVSDKPGSVKLYICPYDTGHHTINQFEGIEKYNPKLSGLKKDFVEVESIVLDHFLSQQKQKIDVIKMDIEGAEFLALSGMDRIIKENNNLKMFIEFFPLLIKEMGGSPEAFIRTLLNEYKFTIFLIPGDYNASNKKLIKMNSYEEIMGFCKDEKDHVNLFLKKNDDKEDEELFLESAHKSYIK